MSSFDGHNFGDAVAHVEGSLGFVLFEGTLFIALLVANSKNNGRSTVPAKSAVQRVREMDALNAKRRAARAAARAALPPTRRREMPPPPTPPTTFAWRGRSRPL